MSNKLYLNIKNSIKYLNTKNYPIVLLNGCFSILHPGHFSLFRFAKQEINNGKNFVVLAANSSSSIKRIKGENKIFFDNLDRLSMYGSIKYIDYSCIFYEDTPLELIEAIKPIDYIVKSEEYKDQKVVGSEYAKIVYAPHQEEHSTTKLIEKIKNG